ncbi:MAG: DegV family protein [Lachnospiraceae bacterium]|nr:DegV family protein [Lachnospiraceae bacterium]
MSYKIVGDSCTDLTVELKKEGYIELVPLSMQVGKETVLDDAGFDQKNFLKMMAECSDCPKSSCPSPEAYMKAFEGADEVFVVTLSAKLSGSYNSAEVAKQLYLEQFPNKKIEIIDSKSASIGQTLIAMKIREEKEGGAIFEKAAERVRNFRDNMKTKFVLENLDNLRKNGRLSNIKAMFCNVLNVKPVMCAQDGLIEKLDQARGMVKALQKMAKYIEEDVKDASKRILAISHCNNPERAVFVRDEIMKRVPFKSAIIADTAGISSLYANDGGIIVAY